MSRLRTTAPTALACLFTASGVLHLVRPAEQPEADRSDVGDRLFGQVGDVAQRFVLGIDGTASLEP